MKISFQSILMYKKLGRAFCCVKMEYTFNGTKYSFQSALSQLSEFNCTWLRMVECTVKSFLISYFFYFISPIFFALYKYDKKKLISSMCLIFYLYSKIYKKFDMFSKYEVLMNIILDENFSNLKYFEKRILDKKD